MPILDPFEDVVQFHRPRGFQSQVHSDQVGNIVLVAGVPAVVPFNNEIFDRFGEFNPATGIFTPIQAGYYYVHSQVTLGNPAVGWLHEIYIYNAAAIVAINSRFYGVLGANQSQNINMLLQLVPTDTVTIQAMATPPAGGVVVGASPRTFIDVFRVA